MDPEISHFVDCFLESAGNIVSISSLGNPLPSFSAEVSPLSLHFYLFLPFSLLLLFPFQDEGVLILTDTFNLLYISIQTKDWARGINLYAPMGTRVFNLSSTLSRAVSIGSSKSLPTQYRGNVNFYTGIM
jgi:hypothetical protein